jgi:PAS domain S-box-containing protein
MEGLFRDLLESLPDGIVLVDPAGLIAFSNPAADRLFGYPRGDLQGKPIDLLLPERYRGAQFWRRDLPGDGPPAGSPRMGIELCGLRRDGTEFPLEINMSPLKTEGGTLVMSAIRDITEHKRIERALNEKNAEFEAANKELEAFDYSIAHDLRAPLTRIEGFSALLAKQYGDKLDERGRDLVQRIAEAGRTMDELVGDLLALSTVTRGALARSDVDVSALAESIVARLRKSEPQREVRFAVPAGIEVRADPGLLRIALENLLGNAWKFTRGRAPARIEMGRLEIEGENVVFVRDDGAGFDLADAERIFKPFQRLHAASAFEGTGIGLATVQRIVRRHGGRVWAEGAIDRGATFFFTVPGVTDKTIPLIQGSPLVPASKDPKAGPS